MLNPDSMKISRFKRLRISIKTYLHISTLSIGCWPADQQYHLSIRYSLIMANSMLTSRPPSKIRSSLVDQKTISLEWRKMFMPLLGTTMLESIYAQLNATTSTAFMIVDGQAANMPAPSVIKQLEGKAIKLSGNRKEQEGFKHQSWLTRVANSMCTT
jgi:hypothetical protein